MKSYLRSNSGKLAFAAVFISLAVIYQFWPLLLAISPVVIVLLVIAASPWLLPMLASRVEAFEVSPTSLKVTLRQMTTATEKIVGNTGNWAGSILLYDSGSGTTTPPEKPTQQSSYLAVYETDPNLALVALRIEIEKRLQALIDKYVHTPLAPGQLRGRSGPYTAKHMLGDLQKAGVFGSEEIAGILELVAAGNAAAHGASVDKEVASWVIENAPKILAAIDSKLAKN